MLQTPSVNVANIMALADFIESGEYEFDMNSGEIILACGSAGCIGGHAAMLWRDIYHKDAERPDFRRGYEGEWLYYDWDSDLFAAKLGISHEQEQHLTFPTRDDCYPYDYESITRAQAIAVLRRLAVTGRVEWDKV